MWVDLTHEAYQAEREQLQAELAMLRAPAQIADVLRQTAAFLRDPPGTWAAATDEERNDLARLAFESVEVKDDRVAAVTVRPDFAPFFAA